MRNGKDSYPFLLHLLGFLGNLDVLDRTTDPSWAEMVGWASRMGDDTDD